MRLSAILSLRFGTLVVIGLFGTHRIVSLPPINEAMSRTAASSPIVQPSDWGETDRRWRCDSMSDKLEMVENRRAGVPRQ
jgi:hypothetical protein